MSSDAAACLQRVVALLIGAAVTVPVAVVALGSAMVATNELEIDTSGWSAFRKVWRSRCARATRRADDRSRLRVDRAAALAVPDGPLGRLTCRGFDTTAHHSRQSLSTSSATDSRIPGADTVDRCCCNHGR